MALLKMSEPWDRPMSKDHSTHPYLFPQDRLQVTAGRGQVWLDWAELPALPQALVRSAVHSWHSSSCAGPLGVTCETALLRFDSFILCALRPWARGLSSCTSIYTSARWGHACLSTL